jgi:hypothetical protein
MKKLKLLSILLLCLMALGLVLLSCEDNAITGPERHFTYFQDATGVRITGYTGPGGSVNIPASIGGRPVTSIGTQAFANKGLTSVTIPNSVTAIWNGAFAHNQLISVTIPNSVTVIERHVFARNQLVSVTIPNSVTAIWNGAFAHNQLISVTIPDSVTRLGADVFTWNNLISITIGSNVTFSVPSSFGPIRFDDAYYNGGRLAGTYTRPHTNSGTWTRN